MIRVIGFGLFCLCLLFCLEKFFATFHNAEEYAARHNTYPRVGTWISSGQCAEKTGILMIQCEKGHKDPQNIYLVPVEEHHRPVDRGMYFVTGLMAIISGHAPDKADLVRFHIVVNLLCLMLLVFFLYKTSGFVVASLALYPGVHFFLQEKILLADAISLYAGVFALSLVPALYLIHKRWQVTWPGVLILAAIPGLIQLFREPYAIGSLLVTLVFTVLTIHLWWRHNAAKALVLVGLSLASMFVFPPSLLMIRQVFWKIPVNWEMPMTRGISHDLVAGLGYYKNPWGFSYSDHKVYAQVMAGPQDYKPHYWDAARKFWWSFLVNDSQRVAKLYQRKLYDTYHVLREEFLKSWGLRNYSLFCVAFALSLALFVIGLCRPRLSSPYQLTRIVLVLGMMTVVGQGLASWPGYIWNYPIIFAMFVFTVMTIPAVSARRLY